LVKKKWGEGGQVQGTRTRPQTSIENLKNTDGWELERGICAEKSGKVPECKFHKKGINGGEVSKRGLGGR